MKYLNINMKNISAKIRLGYTNPGMIMVVALIMFLSLTHRASAQDLDPVTPNYQLVPAGSYVIAMDNELQYDATNGAFNIKAYGLLATLLDNRIALYWSIRAGKAKDDTDFSAMATRVFPSAAVASPRQFKAGPFLVQPTDSAMYGKRVASRR